MSTVVICVKNMKHQLCVITMKMLQNFNTSIQFSNYNLLSLSYWLIGKSVLLLLNDKVKSANCFVKNNMDLKSCGSKVVGSRRFSLSKYFWNDLHTIFLTGTRMKPPQDTNYVLVELNYFIKPPIKMKGFLVMIYIQVHIYNSE